LYGPRQLNPFLFALTRKKINRLLAVLNPFPLSFDKEVINAHFICGHATGLTLRKTVKRPRKLHAKTAESFLLFHEAVFCKDKLLLRLTFKIRTMPNNHGKSGLVLGHRVFLLAALF
jgi:hypothetical protein